MYSPPTHALPYLIRGLGKTKSLWKIKLTKESEQRGVIGKPRANGFFFSSQRLFIFFFLLAVQGGKRKEHKASAERYLRKSETEGKPRSRFPDSE